MALLDSIDGPADLRTLRPDQLPQLAQEIRDFLITSVTRTGGHLGPNLGVVELTIALHRVFDSPRDAVVWDTGHQAYVHKLLTGRKDFDRLRTKGGLSGYPSRSESPHDVVENSHASTALSWADGIAKARRVQGERERHTVAVIGDGALTGGMAWEALNNIAADKDLPLVIVVNDNARSYAPTKGGLADHLATLRTKRGYESVLDFGKVALSRTPVVGGVMYDAVHGLKKGIKDVLSPQGMFEDLGLKYVGPVDGHQEQSIEHALRKAKAFGGPVIVHVITKKGKGYGLARANEADRFHAVDKINPETGLPLQVKGRRDHRRDAHPRGSGGVRPPVPRPGLRRRHRRAARAHHGRGPRVCRPASGRVRLRHLPQPRLRPAAHGLRHAWRRRPTAHGLRDASGRCHCGA